MNLHEAYLAAQLTEKSVSGDVAEVRAAVGYTRKNLLKSTAQTGSSNGITYTVNADGSITANGTASGGNSTFRINSNYHLEPGRYILSGCPEGGSATGYRIQMSLLDYTYKHRDTSGNPTITVTESTDYIVSIIIGTGTVVSNLTFRPMIRYAEIADKTYEPYKPSVEERLAALEAAVNA